MRCQLCLALALCLAASALATASASGSTSSKPIPGYDERMAAIFKTSIEAFVEARAARSDETTAISFIPAEAEPILPFLHGLNRRPKLTPNKAERDAVCTGCVVAVNTVVSMFESGMEVESIVDIITEVCVGLNLFSYVVCHGAISNYAPELAFMAESRGMSGRHFCALILGKDCGDWEEISDWHIQVPEGKPPVQEPALPEDGSPTLRFLHLSDVHVDLTYTLGSTGRDCDQVMCCTNATFPAPSPDLEAGYWGDAFCDLPQWTFQNILDHISQTHPDIDYVYVTGDFSPHDIWLQSRGMQHLHTSTTVDMIAQAFPGKQVFPAVGNHEAFPCNSFPTRAVEGEYNPGWLYDGLAEYYSVWLGHDAAAIATIQQEGYYSTLLAPGKRIISINSNYCLFFNFWLNYDWVDPAGLLSWLVTELTAAEANGELVHILSHVPPVECLGGWSREFNQIIDRFESTVRGQFYGHTHNDEFVVFYDVENATRPINVGWLTPSVTPWSERNPAYRIYTVDEASWRVLDFDTYIFDLAQANAKDEDGNPGQPEYVLEYKPLEDYQMNSLFPADYDDLARRLVTDDQLYDKFYLHFDHYESEIEDRREVICRMVTVNNLDDSKCVEIAGPEP